MFTNEWQLLVMRFHQLGEITIAHPDAKSGWNQPGGEFLDLLRLRAKLTVEETFETLRGLSAGMPDEVWKAISDMIVESIGRGAYSPSETADGLADMEVINHGTAVALGIDLAPIFDEVMVTNFAKFEGGVRRRADGKILKPEGWKPPRIPALLKEQGFTFCDCDPPSDAIPCPDCGVGC